MDATTGEELMHTASRMTRAVSGCIGLWYTHAYNDLSRWGAMVSLGCERETPYGPDPACARRAVPPAQRRGTHHRLPAESGRPVSRSGRVFAPPHRFFLPRRDALRSRAARAP